MRIIFFLLFLTISGMAHAGTDAPGCELRERASIKGKVYGIKEDPAEAINVVDQRLEQAEAIAAKISANDYILNESEYNLIPQELPRNSQKPLAWEVSGSFTVEVNSSKIGKALMLELIKNDFDVRLSVSARRDSICRLKKS
ncbi:MAG: hypothetical protein LRY50_14795 [Geovibrio sp.]|nr:hypothetical protein [Geovibrio sp.]